MSAINFDLEKVRSYFTSSTILRQAAQPINFRLGMWNLRITDSE
ncbi:hypothetical protein [Microcoleus sp.]